MTRRPSRCDKDAGIRSEIRRAWPHHPAAHRSSPVGTPATRALRLERAVFLPREVFDYRYEEIAEVVGKSEVNCRQIAVRARRQVEQRKPRFEVSRNRREELTRRFFEAVANEDATGLVDLPGAILPGTHGDPVVVVSLDIADGVVQAVRAISNPEKLRHLGSFLDLRRPRS